ncbi:ORC1-type DNA replication protein [Candidatus Woesearchaeota archaeon]|nr:ORC1-type DNA replication protein [Candidatus Woesearchaeota archaeon]
MKQKGLGGFFESFLEKEPLFKDKKILQASYTPETVPHREQQIEQIANVLAPSLRLEKPSNLFIYGKTGTGKTLSTKYTLNKLLEVAKKQNIPLRVSYINCKLKKVADTEYRLVAQLIKDLGREIPPTGLPTDEVYKIFFNILDSKKQLLIIILDEIDQLVKKAGDEILYNFTRVNPELENSQITIVGISNDLMFTDTLDPRVKSSLSEEEQDFPPYNAMQLQDILYQRSRQAFKESTISSGVVEKCAAYAAREHGDARRALELLRVAGEICERKGHTKVQIEHIDEAEDKIERDRIVEIIKTQPKQFQVTLYSIFHISLNKNGQIFTGDIYEIYKRICNQLGLRPLTQRRLSDIIAELDMLGIINAKVISKGRYGRTREITLATPDEANQKFREILEKELGLIRY